MKTEKVKTMKTKVCTGPAHPEPVELPIEEFHTRKSGDRAGQPISRCKRCVNWNKLQNHTPNHGYVKFDRLLWEHVRELINRVGIMNAAKLSGISDSSLRFMLKGNPAQIQKETARKILTAVQYERQNAIFYHRTDIQRGIERKKRERKPLRKVEDPSDQYGPVYPDAEQEAREYANAMRRASRARRTPEQVEADRIKDRERRLRYRVQDAERKRVQRALAKQAQREDELNRLTGY